MWSDAAGILLPELLDAVWRGHREYVRHGSSAWPYSNRILPIRQTTLAGTNGADGDYPACRCDKNSRDQNHVPTFAGQFRGRACSAATKSLREGSMLGSSESRRTKLDRLASSIPKHEFEFLMKLGKMTRVETLELIEKHDGDRTEIYADLARNIARRSSR
jgi:hypothetical protein